MIDYKNTFGMEKVNGETSFITSVKKNKTRNKLLSDGIAYGKVKSFDQDIITDLRKCYFDTFSGLMYMYLSETSFCNISSKAKLFAWILRDKNFKLVKGNIYSTKNTLFYIYGVKHLDYNLWFEVVEGNKEWVYDLYSLLKIEKNLYYELEEPVIEEIYLKDEIDLEHDHSNYNNKYDSLIYEMLDSIENELENHPYRELLEPEIVKYRSDISRKIKKKSF